MNGFIQLKSNTLKIPGVRGVHRFLQISDTHAICTDESSSVQDIEKAAKMEKAWDDVKRGFAAHFGEPFNAEHDIPTREALVKLVDYAAQNKPEMLLLSGDIIDYITPAAVAFMKDVLDGYGGDYIFVPGNHEGSLAKNKVLLPFSHDSEGLCVYNGDGFIIAGVDNSEKVISDIQLSRLKELAGGSTPVILLMHMPIATNMNAEEMKRFDSYYIIDKNANDANARELVGMLESPSCAVCAILCGHVHGYHYSLFADGKPQICASSGLVGFVHELIITG